MRPRIYLIAFQTIVIKEVRRLLRIWVQTVLPAGVTTTLYFLIFGKLIGSRIGSISGIDFIDFIVPGLILMPVISNSYGNVVSSFFSTKFQRHVEELIVAPIPNWIILAGYVTGGVARGMVVGVVVTAVALIFTRPSFPHLGISFAVVLLTAILFALGGFVNAVFARNFDDISLVPTFILTPLTYLGGVFYSVDLLPEFWQQVSLVNPILYMVNAFRYGLLGVSDVSVTVAFAIIVFFIVGLAAVSLVLLNRGFGIKS